MPFDLFTSILLRVVGIDATVVCKYGIYMLKLSVFFRGVFGDRCGKIVYLVCMLNVLNVCLGFGSRLD